MDARISFIAADIYETGNTSNTRITELYYTTIVT